MITVALILLIFNAAIVAVVLTNRSLRKHNQRPEPAGDSQHRGPYRNPNFVPEPQQRRGPPRRSTLPEPLASLRNIKSTLPYVWITIKLIALPIILCQALALVSFIHEEAIQAAGFAAYGAIKSGDAPIALSCVSRFERVMLQAQAFQDRLGWIAWWAAPAYESYFFQAAPAQLCSFYSQGVAAELWEPDVSRWVMRQSDDARQITTQFVDTWKLNPIDRLRARGFRPELIWPEMLGPPGTDESPENESFQDRQAERP